MASLGEITLTNEWQPLSNLINFDSDAVYEFQNNSLGVAVFFDSSTQPDKTSIVGKKLYPKCGVLKYKKNSGNLYLRALDSNDTAILTIDDDK